MYRLSVEYCKEYKIVVQKDYTCVCIDSDKIFGQCNAYDMT